MKVLIKGTTFLNGGRTLPFLQKHNLQQARRLAPPRWFLDTLGQPRNLSVGAVT